MYAFINIVMLRFRLSYQKKKLFLILARNVLISGFLLLLLFLSVSGFQFFL